MSFKSSATCLWLPWFPYIPVSFFARGLPFPGSAWAPILTAPYSCLRFHILYSFCYLEVLNGGIDPSWLTLSMDNLDLLSPTLRLPDSARCRVRCHTYCFLGFLLLFPWKYPLKAKFVISGFYKFLSFPRTTHYMLMD